VQYNGSMKSGERTTIHKAVSRELESQTLAIIERITHKLSPRTITHQKPPGDNHHRILTPETILWGFLPEVCCADTYTAPEVCVDFLGKISAVHRLTQIVWVNVENGL